MLTPRAKRPPGIAGAEEDDFAAAVLDGLSRPAKTLPCRFFYDQRGSELFEEITRLPEYYPTRTETAILEALMRNAGHHVSTRRLEDSIYSWDREVESNTVQVYISRLRKRFGNDVIENKRGVGYRIAK